MAAGRSAGWEAELDDARRALAPASLRREGARSLSRNACRGLSRAFAHPPIPGRAIEPDLSDRDGFRKLRAAQEAARKAPRLGPYGRARIPRAEGAARL